MTAHPFHSLYGFPPDTLDRALSGDFSALIARGITPGDMITPVGEVMTRLWAIPGEAALRALIQLNRLGVPVGARAHVNDVDGLMNLALHPWDAEGLTSEEALDRVDHWVVLGGPLDQQVWGRTVLGEMAKANPAWLAAVATRGFTRMAGNRPLVDYLAQWGTPMAVEAALALPEHGGLGACDLGHLLGHLLQGWTSLDAGESLMKLATRVARTWLTVADPWAGQLVTTVTRTPREVSPVEILASWRGDLERLPLHCRQMGSEAEKGNRRVRFLDAWAQHLRPLAVALAQEAWAARDTIEDARGLWLAWVMKDAVMAERWARWLPQGQTVAMPPASMAYAKDNPASAWVAGYLRQAQRVRPSPGDTREQTQILTKTLNQALAGARTQGVDVLGVLQADRREAQARDLGPTRTRTRPRG